MKRILVLLLAAAILSGCKAEPTWETIEDVVPVEAVTVAQQLYIQLPQEAVSPTFQDDATGELYLCNNYTLTKQIIPSGDLEKTVRSISGLSKDQLQIMHTLQEGLDRYDFVWTAAAEEGLQLGRACILDDGNYHYIVSTMAAEEHSGDLQQTWAEIFDSCRLLPADLSLNTGS